jgi:ribose/xylose/arabinose/galactoside ABC-type transport system permease subunit
VTTATTATTAAATAAVARRERIRAFAEAYGIFIVAMLVFAFCAISTEVFLSPANLRNILIQISVVGVAAIGGTVVLLAGAIDLSVGGVVLLGAVVIGDLAERQGLPLPVAIGVGLVVTTLAGLVSGFLVAVVKVESILATLATLLLSAGVARFILGPTWILVGDDFFASLARDPVVLNLPAMVVVMIVLYLVVGQLMQRTPFGRNVYAVGNNPRAAELSGLPLTRTMLGAFAVAGLCAGIASLLMIAQVGIISYSDAVGLEFAVITAALIGGLSVTRGGVGRVEKTLVGAAIVGMLANYQTLQGVPPEYQTAVLGGVLLLAIIADRLIRGERDA